MVRPPLRLEGKVRLDSIGLLGRELEEPWEFTCMPVGVGCCLGSTREPSKVSESRVGGAMGCLLLQPCG